MRKLFLFIGMILAVSSWGQDVILEPYEVVEIRALAASQTRDWGHVYLQASEFKGEGKGVYVFVLDTGIDSDHPDLKGNIDIRYCKDFTRSASGFEDVHGHGTHCAGIIGAIDNNEGVIGIATNVKIVAVKVLNDQGSGSYTDIIAGIRYVADLQISEQKIISMSLGGSSTTPAFEDAINYAISKGVYIVAAAGNSYCTVPNSIGYPGKYPQVITVGSIGKTAQPSDFSSCGEQLDIAAPGEGVYSTHKNGSYAYLSGTSMATPQVTGIIAKLLSRYKFTSQKEMEAYLGKYASDLYDKGWDKRTGYGAPIATNYSEGPDGELPDDPNPDPNPEPPAVYKARTVSIPIRNYYDNILFKSTTDGAYRYMSVGGIVVEYKTTKSAELASQEINALADNFFTRRGFILPQDQCDIDFTAAWAAYFFRLLAKNSGYDVNISEMWAAEGLSDDRTLIYYTKDYPVGSKVLEKQFVKTRAAKKMQRRGEIATLNWN